MASSPQDSRLAAEPVAGLLVVDLLGVMSRVDRMLGWFPHISRGSIELIIVAILLLLLMMTVRWASQFWG
jgi:hypothetical protein